MVKVIQNENTIELKRLLSIHPNIVHMRDGIADTLLMMTAEYTDNSSIVNIFIEYGCDVWAMNNKYNYNAYHIAALYNHHKILDTLCRHDVTNINRGAGDNLTPLHHAAYRGNISCVDVLLRHNNIDVAVKDRRGLTAYDMAGSLMNKQNRDEIRKMIKDYEKSRKESRE
ncbi:uncharacterized protein LOC130629151 [Hydractinia symbiolongicarpus]|uniref:uncharacterized protein LOC130629151 n=1 Tax=Hydractinia symbiolongicarpus TaxID=13093 RepID=UPI0025517F8F|nr:uncharacterized protein LOC130629151 [Hydractinia symbiolongicarpus]